jgi:hypothetical protein
MENVKPEFQHLNEGRSIANYPLALVLTTESASARPVNNALVDELQASHIDRPLAPFLYARRQARGQDSDETTIKQNQMTKMRIVLLHDYQIADSSSSIIIVVVVSIAAQLASHF